MCVCSLVCVCVVECIRADAACCVLCVWYALCVQFCLCMRAFYLGLVCNFFDVCVQFCCVHVCFIVYAFVLCVQHLFRILVLLSISIPLVVVELYSRLCQG